jgi:ribose 5-phosphate isomerase B
MIAIGADHGGFILKEELINSLKGEIEFKDFGTISLDSVNYPEIAFEVAESVSRGECEAGVLICKSGIGMSIAANKVRNIRCAKIHTTKEARLCKEHNDANVIAIGAEEMTVEGLKEIIYIWLSSEFAGGRHKTRVDLITNYENKI